MFFSRAKERRWWRTSRKAVSKRRASPNSRQTEAFLKMDLVTFDWHSHGFSVEPKCPNITPGYRQCLCDKRHSSAGDVVVDLTIGHAHTTCVHEKLMVPLWFPKLCWGWVEKSQHCAPARPSATVGNCLVPGHWKILVSPVASGHFPWRTGMNCTFAGRNRVQSVHNHLGVERRMEEGRACFPTAHSGYFFAQSPLFFCRGCGVVFLVVRQTVFACLFVLLFHWSFVS